MTGVPRSIETAVDQAKEATRAAIQAGLPRLVIDLNIPELKRIQGFGDDYILLGTKTQQKKFIGNAVHRLVPKAWFEAFGEVWINKQSQQTNAA